VWLQTEPDKIASDSGASGATMIYSPSTTRHFARAGVCLAAMAIAVAAGKARAQEENSKPAASAVDYQALEQPPRGGVRLDKFLEGVPQAERPARRWKFYERDLDGDGWLSPEEVASDDPAKVSPIAQRFHALDADANGSLSRPEYVAPADSKLQGEAKTNFEKTATLEFAQFDHDEDGQLSFEEFCFTPRSTRTAASRFRRLDADADGRLTIREFLAPYAPAYRFQQRSGFFNSDADNDQRLGLEEFTKFGQGVVLSLKNEYLMRDADDDGRISREEFVRPSLGRPWEALERKQAEEIDQDGDGSISLLEFAVTRPGRFRELFGLLDRDGDGVLTLAEFARPRSRNDRQSGAIFFALDVDADGRLAPDEFLEQEKPVAERRARPDPVVAMSRSRLDAMAPACQAADADRDGRLNPSEWPQARIDGLAAELAGIPFAEWDRNHDGFVTAEERKELVELAFGVALPGGRPLRKPGGVVLGTLFDECDKDQDGAVSRDEFLARNRYNEKTADVFKECDQDGDGALTLAEALRLTEMFTSVAVNFLNADADFDGRATQFEVDLAAAHQERGATRGLVAAFDLNGDRGLQFDEYLLCPQANPRAAWHIGRQDTDDDGRISWAEFHGGRGALFYALSRYFFTRYDRNGDGTLSPGEFEFVFDPQKSPPLPPDELAEYERPPPGAVTFEKFIAGAAQAERPAREWKFYERDFDGDRLLSQDELALDDPSRVSPHVRRFRLLDADGDGLLSLTEYVESADSRREGDAKTAFEKSARIEFAICDRDADERLTFDEFGFTPPLNLAPAPYFRRLDADHNGRLSVREFLAPWSAAEQIKQRRAFYFWDSDNDQQVSLYEMMRRGNGVVPSLKNEYLAHDIDGDGKMSYEEFYRDALGQPSESDARKWAREMDTDDDGSLSLLEWAISRGNHFAELFTLKDANGDNALSYLEFRQPHPPHAHLFLEHAFYLADFDADGVLSLEEFLEHKKPGNESEKRVRSDVLVALAGKRVAQLASVFKAADADRDGRLSAQEWPQAQIEKRAAELAGIPFTDWDRNHDGFVSGDERRELVELALGVALPGGLPLRKSGGMVLGGLFRSWDKDQDGTLSRDEFLANHWDSEKKADLFKAWDQDGDGKLTLAEAAAVKDLFTNMFDEFFKFDRDFDGKVTQEELDEVAGFSERATVEHLLPAFDLNGDGGLQLDEFLLSTKGNPYAALLARRSDADGDGSLSWEEYCGGEGPAFYGLLHSFFIRFDRNHDGVLSLTELDFQLDLNKAAPESILVKLDRNGDGVVALNDLIDPTVPNADDPPAVLRHEEQMIRIEEAFQIADADGDGRLSLEELSKHQALIMAAVEGRSIPVRATRAAAESPSRLPSRASRGAPAGAEADDFRLLAILGFNVLLVGGVAWMVFRRK
jgi:Ca2+-binding EF-hand superfamily protein